MSNKQRTIGKKAIDILPKVISDGKSNLVYYFRKPTTLGL